MYVLRTYRTPYVSQGAGVQIKLDDHHAERDFVASSQD